jgi:CDP-glucose 4,6-dehydratase
MIKKRVELMLKSVAITGATGLLGSHLANSMVNSGYQVFALIKDENSKSLLSEEVTRVYGDISNRSDIEYFIQKAAPSIFVHLAAQTQAYDSLRYPYQTFFNNIVGTLNVLECLREYSLCESIVIASSDKAYGELIGERYTESHQLRGVYPYDASKSSTDLIANSYRITYSMPISVTRACNIYGPGDYNVQRLIPGIVGSYKHNKIFIIRNQGKDLREYIHVSDVVDAYEKIIQLAAQSGTGDDFNISTGERYETLEIFNLIQTTIGEKISHKILDEESLEIRRQFMDSSHLTNSTSWKPRIKLKDDLVETVDWYLKNL